MKSSGKQRENNIELLRIIMMLGVIFLHINSVTGKALMFVEIGSINEWILYIGDYSFVCAVDTFMLISGYFLSVTNERTVYKPINLLLQVVVWAEVEYFISIVIGKRSFSLYMLIARMIPRNYFVTLFLVVYIISPYINILLEELEKREQLKQFVSLSFILFSVFPFFVDIISTVIKFDLNALCTIGFFGSEWGYTIVNFILLWVIGAYIRKRNIELGMKMSVVFYEIIVFIEVILAKSSSFFGKNMIDCASAYCNPLVILNAILLFNIFKKIKIENGIIIKNFAQASMTVLLLHEYFLQMFDFESIVGKPAGQMIVWIVCIAISVYFLCFVLWKVYSVSVERLLNFIVEYLANKKGKDK
mgnify:CR=1 FL=1